MPGVNYDESASLVTYIIAFIAEPEERQTGPLLGELPLTSSEEFS